MGCRVVTGDCYKSAHNDQRPRKLVQNDIDCLYPGALERHLKGHKKSTASRYKKGVKGINS
jgi:hypothetical protein